MAFQWVWREYSHVGLSQDGIVRFSVVIAVKCGLGCLVSGKTGQLIEIRRC